MIKKLYGFLDDESCQTKDDLELKICSAFPTNEEQNLLNESSEINNIKTKILNNFEKKIKGKIYNKLIEISINKSFEKYDEFFEEVKNALMLEGKTTFLNDSEIITEINKTWNNIEKKNQISLEEKRNQFKNTIDKKIYDVYLNNKNSIKEKEDLKEMFEKSLSFEQNKLLNDIQIYYEQELNSIWNNISQEGENLRKKLFKENIVDKIEEIYDSSLHKKQEDLEQDVLDSLNQEEKNFLTKDNDKFDESIYNFYRKKLKNFWKKIKEEKANLIENEKRKIKEKIEFKLNSFYSFYSKCESEEEFTKDILPQLDFTEKEKNMIKENEELENYKTQKIKLFWKKIETIKEEEKRNNEKYEKFIQSHQEKLNKIKLENEEKQKEQEAKIAKLMEEQQKDKIDRENKAKEYELQLKEQERKLKEDSEKLIKNLEEKYQKEKDEEKQKQILEEQRRIKELEEKKEKIKKEFDEEINKKKEDKIKKIENDLRKMESTFCMKEIQKFDLENIKNLIIQLFKSNKIARFTDENLKIYIDKNHNNIKNTEHLNIILVGPSGVGKSTLINAILELEEKTKSGFGKPETMEIGFYESKKLTFLRLADSRGIEKTIESGVDAICQQIQDFIKKQLDAKDPDKFIHCIWYCWTGARLEKSEIEVLSKLSQQYSYKTLPVIIVYTNAIDQNQVEEAQNYIKDFLKLSNNFIPILAKEKIVGTQTNNGLTIKPYNLDKLTEVSIDLAKSAVESSCYQGLIENIKKIISEEITNLTNGVKKTIDNDIKNILDKMNNNSKIEDLYTDNTNIIFNIFYKYIFLNSNLRIEDFNNPIVKIGEKDFSITKDSQITIKKFVTDYFENILESYKKILNELLKKYTEELSNEIIKFQVEFNDKKENLLKVPWKVEELKEMLNLYICEKISKTTELMVLKNSFVYLINPIIEKFGNYFKEMYNQGLMDKKFKEYAKKIIPSSFNEIEKKVKEYYEKKNKEMAPTPLDETKNQTTNDIACLRGEDSEEEKEEDRQ